MSREGGPQAKGQETTHLSNNGGPWADKEKQEPPDWQETTHFGGNKRHGDRQRKVGKGRNLRHPNVTCCSLCPHYNKISFVDKKYPSCTDAMTLPIKAKWGHKSLLPSGRWSWDENQGIWPQTPPSPVNILPLHFHAPHNQLAKETQGSYSCETVHSPLESVLLLK